MLDKTAHEELQRDVDMGRSGRGTGAGASARPSAKAKVIPKEFAFPPEQHDIDGFNVTEMYDELTRAATNADSLCCCLSEARVDKIIQKYRGNEMAEKYCKNQAKTSHHRVRWKALEIAVTSRRRSSTSQVESLSSDWVGEYSSICRSLTRLLCTFCCCCSCCGAAHFCGGFEAGRQLVLRSRDSYYDTFSELPFLGLCF